MKLEQMQRVLDSTRLSLRDRGLDGAMSAIHDLVDIVQALVDREVTKVPLPRDDDPFPRRPPQGPMRMTVVPAKTLLDMSNAEIDRFFPRGTVVNHYYVRRDYELYQPHPEQPQLLSIRRKAK